MEFFRSTLPGLQIFITHCLCSCRQQEKQYYSYVRKRIQTATTPMASKMTQRCAVKAGWVRRDWADPTKEIRIHAMLWVLEEKLFCNEIFKDALLATGDKPIVEISRKDNFWGCKSISGDRLTGKNILGQLLTDLRSRINEVRDGRMSYPCGWLLL